MRILSILAACSIVAAALLVSDPAAAAKKKRYAKCKDVCTFYVWVPPCPFLMSCPCIKMDKQCGK